jgi:hypothetical protein
MGFLHYLPISAIISEGETLVKNEFKRNLKESVSVLSFG